MRRRLLLIVLGLLAGSLAAFAIPQGMTFAERTSQDAFITQATDTTRFATLAEGALRDDRADALAFELRRHDQLYGVAVLVTDAEGRVVVRSRATVRPEDPEVAAALAVALGGNATEKPHTAWPWDPRPYVVAEPAGRDSQVVGAVVTVAPTDVVRGAIQRRLLALVARFLSLVLLAGLLLGLPLVRWVLRPVDRLAAAARGIAEGRFDARVLGSGPPELRRLADAFNTMAGSVQRAFEQQRFFVAQASHQLRNPLTALRLRVELLGPHVREAGVEEHRHALAEVERLSTMLDALLRFAGTEAARADRRPIAVAAVVADRVAFWGPAYDRAQTPLAVTMPERNPEARLVPGVLDQVLDALLDNALKFAPGAPVRLDVTATAGKVFVSVADSGPGLSPTDLERVGERFWRSTTHQNAPGTGLGLAIAAKLMAAAGGSLEIGPGTPGGLRAVVTLPVELPRQIEGPREEPSAVRTGVVAIRERVFPNGALRGTTAPRRDADPADTSRSPSGD